MALDQKTKDLIISLWNEGSSASIIVKALYEQGVHTKNQVIGIVHRAKAKGIYVRVSEFHLNLSKTTIKARVARAAQTGTPVASLPPKPPRARRRPRPKPLAVAPPPPPELDPPEALSGEPWADPTASEKKPLERPRKGSRGRVAPKVSPVERMADASRATYQPAPTLAPVTPRGGVKIIRVKVKPPKQLDKPVGTWGVLDLKDGFCKYTNSTKKPYLFCGRVAHMGSSWCEEHHARVFTPRTMNRRY